MTYLYEFRLHLTLQLNFKKATHFDKGIESFNQNTKR